MHPMPQFPAAHTVLTAAIRDRAFPGAAFGVWLRGQVIAIESVGCFTYESDSPAVQPQTIFDMASVTKVMATTAMAMLLWERGQLDLDEPAGNHLPEFVRATPSDNVKRTITPRMLLAHSSGLPAYERLYQRCSTRAELLNAVMRMPLESPPETHAVYSDIGFIVLGEWLQRLAGEPLDTFCQREIFAPLGMSATEFNPSAEQRPHIPPTQLYDPLRKRRVQGEVHDRNGWVMGGVSGHAGLFSNVADTLQFAACILNHGAPLFRPETVSLFTTRQSHPTGTSRALGWDTPSDPSSSGSFFSSHSAGHLGYTGTSLWIDFDAQLAVVLLTNRTWPGEGMQGVCEKIQQVRPHFHDAILRELGLASA